MSEDSSVGEEIEYSRALFLCSADDAASTIDYSKAVNIDDGVVDSPPSRGPLLTFAKSPSPLRTQSWTPFDRDQSPSPKHADALACKTPQRQLYCTTAPPVVMDNEVPLIGSVVENIVPIAVTMPTSSMCVAPTNTCNTRKGTRTLPPFSSSAGKRLKGDGSKSDPQSSPRPYMKSNSKFYGQFQPPYITHSNEGCVGCKFSRREDIMRGMEKLRQSNLVENGGRSV